MKLEEYREKIDTVDEKLVALFAERMELSRAIEECKKTLAGRNDTPLIDRVKKMVVAFAKIGVTQEQIEKRLKKKIDTMNADDFVEYTGIYNAIKQGESKIAEWFESDPIASDLTNELKGDVL